MAQRIMTHLMFAGEAEQAINFYVTLFKDSKIRQIEHYGPGEAGQRRVESLCGAFVIGLPCIWYALTGRWPGPGPEEPPRVEFDREQIRCADGVGDESDTRFAWSAVVRIGFRTTDEWFRLNSAMASLKPRTCSRP